MTFELMDAGKAGKFNPFCQYIQPTKVWLSSDFWTGNTVVSLSFARNNADLIWNCKSFYYMFR